MLDFLKKLLEKWDKNVTLIVMDDSRPGNGKPVTGRDIRQALDQILDGNTISENQIPSIGCNIKWK